MRVSAWIALCTLLALPSMAQDKPPVGDFIVEAFVNNASPYLGEQIVYTFRYYTYGSEETVEYLPDFEGFWVLDTYPLRDRSIETINGRQYRVSELSAEILPLYIGEVTIAPASLNIPENVFRSSRTFETEPVMIHVLPLPPGAPEGFSGAVGQYNITANIDTTRITLGQPVTLTLIVDGSGGLDSLPGPSIPSPPGWRVYPGTAKYVVGTLGGLRYGQRLYEWLLIPEQTGSRAFPEINFSFFDPQLAEYKSIELPGFEVEVFSGENNLEMLPSFSQAENPDTKRLPLKTVSLTPELDHGKSDTWVQMLWLIPPLFPVLCGIWAFCFPKMIEMRKQSKRANALRAAHERLQSTHKMSSTQAGQSIVNIVCAYAADRLGLEQVQAVDLATVWLEHPVDPEIISQLVHTVLWADSSRYIPGGFDFDMRSLTEKVADLLTIIDQNC